MKKLSGFYISKIGLTLVIVFFGAFLFLSNNTKCSINENYDTLSDRRLKNVGEQFRGGLKEINQIKSYNYTFRDDVDKLPHAGVMAQDLIKVFPNAVAKAPDGFYRIRKEEIFYSLINSVQELDQKNINLEKKVVDLENKNAKLETDKKELLGKINTIEKRLASLEKVK